MVQTNQFHLIRFSQLAFIAHPPGDIFCEVFPVHRRYPLQVLGGWGHFKRVWVWLKHMFQDGVQIGIAFFLGVQLHSTINFFGGQQILSQTQRII